MAHKTAKELIAAIIEGALLFAWIRQNSAGDTGDFNLNDMSECLAYSSATDEGGEQIISWREHYEPPLKPPRQ